MRIRNWNLTQPMQSHIVCRGPADDDSSTARYQHKVIDGVEVTVEEYYRRKNTSSPSTTVSNSSSSTATATTPTEIRTTKASANIPPAHTDTITSMQLVMSKERTPYLITASCDAVVKIWK